MFDLNICEAYVAHFAVNMIHIEWMLFLAVALEQNVLQIHYVSTSQETSPSI